MILSAALCTASTDAKSVMTAAGGRHELADGTCYTSFTIGLLIDIRISAAVRRIFLIS